MKTTELTAPSGIGEILVKLTHLRQRGTNKWSADCPVPGHVTSNGHLSIEDAGDKALVKCFSAHTYEQICQAVGLDTLTYPAKGIPGPRKQKPAVKKEPLHDFTELANEQHALLLNTPKAIDYLASRLIDGWSIERWLLGYNAEKDAITIPHMVDGKVPAVKYRLLHPKEGEPKYQCEPGSNLDHIFNPEQITADAVYICEGEFDAMVATRNAFNACSLPGGAGSFKPEFVRYFARIRDVFLTLDADEGGFTGMKKIKELMPAQAIPVRLPDGMDVTDFFVAGYSPDDLADLCKKAWKFNRLPPVSGVVRL